uniref:Neurotransmitter-gated ion-channel ligand-binding domain-containing protein n=1 Tax=Panagrolaimus sp. JU765 TaxID=591449 RepID=A0AC34R7E9_9BILA
MGRFFSLFVFIQALNLVCHGSTQLRLIQDMLESYDRKAKPTYDNDKPVNVTFSMDLYQILELNEPQQYILLNSWIIERWHDEFLYWSPAEYNNITEIRLPYNSIWIPDTTLYENLVMKDDDTRRLLNAKLTTNMTRKAALVELLYPTIYKFSCLLNLRFFPFDIQKKCRSESPRFFPCRF